MDHILSIVLFTPLAGLIVLLFIPATNPRAVKLWANAASFIGFLVSLPLAMWWLARRLDVTLACALFALIWMPLLYLHRRAEDLAVLQRLRMQYRYSAIALGAVLFFFGRS